MSESLPRGTHRPEDPAYQVEFIRGEGCYLWDSYGKQYLDFVAGYSSLSFGHSHPRLVAAAKSQLDTLVHLVGWRHPWRSQLADRLAEVAPIRSPGRVWISTTGARAIEIAWKIAYANKPGMIVSFDYGFHGRSIATSQITQTEKLDIRLPQAFASVAGRPQSISSLPVLAYPTCEDCPLGLSRFSCAAECFDESEAWLRTHQQAISAVVVEPALGARGYYFAANGFFHRLRNLTRELGILLIDDEIQMGLGRLGSLFAASQQGWEPDLVVLGKSLGGGLLNISAVIGPDGLMNKLGPGIESETFAADPLACRVAIEALDLFHEDVEPSLGNLSEALRSEIHRLQNEVGHRFAKHRLRVESMGCAAIVQIIPDNSRHGTISNSPEATPASIALAWAGRALHAGLLVHWSGKNRDRLVLIPPLISEPKLIHKAIDILISTIAPDNG